MRKLAIFALFMTSVICCAITIPKVWIASEPILADDLNNNFSALNNSATTQTIPSGIIAMWSGSAYNIPAGWALCNGANGTPNLTNRFIVAAGGTYSAGVLGGLATYTLTTIASLSVAEAHGHIVEAYTSVPGSGTASVSAGVDYNLLNHVHYVDTVTGLSGTHTHDLNASFSTSALPPYYALCYIMKL